MVNKVLFSSKSSEWGTPRYVFDYLTMKFGAPFDLDPCTSADNPLGTPNFYTVKEDGLKQPWFGLVYMNPPYGRRVIGPWVEKAYRESMRGVRVVALLPARTDTYWWHNWVMLAPRVWFVRGRITFVGAKDSAPFPTAVVLFDVGLKTQIFDSMVIPKYTMVVPK